MLHREGFSLRMCCCFCLQPASFRTQTSRHCSDVGRPCSAAATYNRRSASLRRPGLSVVRVALGRDDACEEQRQRAKHAFRQPHCKKTSASQPPGAGRNLISPHRLRRTRPLRRAPHQATATPLQPAEPSTPRWSGGSRWRIHPQVSLRQRRDPRTATVDLRALFFACRDVSVEN